NNEAVGGVLGMSPCASLIFCDSSLTVSGRGKLPTPPPEITRESSPLKNGGTFRCRGSGEGSGADPGPGSQRPGGPVSRRLPGGEAKHNTCLLLALRPDLKSNSSQRAIGPMGQRMQGGSHGPVPAGDCPERANAQKPMIPDARQRLMPGDMPD